MTSPMLRIRNLKKTYLQPDGQPLQVLDIPKFEVAAGEQLALIGRSGCGKSTLLHVIAGIGAATAGSVEIDGLDITRLYEAGVTAFGRRRSATSFKRSICCPALRPSKTCNWG